MVKVPQSSDMSAMQPLSTYVGSVERLVRTVVSSGVDSLSMELAPVLNGGPSDALRDTVDLFARKSTGAFFSGSDLSDELVSNFTECINEDSRILDPACGHLPSLQSHRDCVTANAPSAYAGELGREAPNRMWRGASLNCI